MANVMTYFIIRKLFLGLPKLIVIIPGNDGNPRRSLKNLDLSSISRFFRMKRRFVPILNNVLAIINAHICIPLFQLA